VPSAAQPAGAWPGGAADQVIAVAAAVVFGLGVLAVVVRQFGRRRPGSLRRRAPPRARESVRHRRPRFAGLLALTRAGSPALAVDGPAPPQVVPDRGARRPLASWWPPLAALVGAAALAALLIVGLSSRTASPSTALALNPSLDPGSALSGRRAPGFTLSDQFGRSVSLRSFRGKVTLLDFNDSECTTICPLTTTAMLDAKRMLGPAARQVQLLGVDANPKATAIDDVLSYSQLHGMLYQWRFLTGSLPQLESVWKDYSVGVTVSQNQIDHEPAIFVINRQGRLERLYLTQLAYSAVPQLGQLLANEVSSLLPSHPVVHSHLSYAQVATISPAGPTSLPGADGGYVTLGPGQPGEANQARLYLFFATWDQEITSLGGQLDALNAYQSAAAADHLPGLTAIDEGSVEPSASTLPNFLASLPHPLSYPVAIDDSGRVADGYGVQGEPWLMLTSPSGEVIWSWEVSSSGWLSNASLDRHIRTALASAAKAAR
jgi:cytochrome oxidase Cu insertion factor (SCO1/SenC/PrrC family)